jgi:hypothetical protein
MIMEGQHDHDDLIYPDRFPFAELIPGWNNFDPNTKNPALNKTFAKGHHVPGGHGKHKRDFEKFTLAFCLEWDQDAEGQWHRCYNQFTVDSNQCITHPKFQYKDGPNQIWRHLKEGRVGNWGMLKNRHMEQEQMPETTAEPAEPKWDDMLAEYERRVAAGEDGLTAWADVEAEFQSKAAIARKINKERAKGRASLRRSGPEGVEDSVADREGVAKLDKKANRNRNQRGTW